MNVWAKDFHLSIDKPVEWPKAAVSPWAVIEPVVAPAYQSDENLKKAYGIELAKSSNSFEAACKVFKEEAEANKALWISFNWLNDPIVVASKDIYAKTLELSKPVLDRAQLAAKALAIADEKILMNGVMVPTVKPVDRLAAIRLYSDIIGYTGKVEIDNSTTNNTVNEMTIKLVRAEGDKKPVTIDNAPNKNVKSEILNDSSPISLKLVKAG